MTFIKHNIVITKIIFDTKWYTEIKILEIFIKFQFHYLEYELLLNSNDIKFFEIDLADN